MYRTKDREKAVKLRLQGWSYTQIQQEIKVGNGTLSYWLKNFPLTEEQKNKIYEKRDICTEKFREAMKVKKEIRDRQIYNDEK